MIALGLLCVAMTVLTDIVSATLYAVTEMTEVAYLRFARDALALALAAIGLFNPRLPRSVKAAGFGYLGLIGLYVVGGAASNAPSFLVITSAAQLSIPVVLAMAGAGSLSSPSGLRRTIGLLTGLGAASAVFGVWDIRNTEFWTDVIGYGDFLYDVKQIQVGYHPTTLLPWNFFGFEELRRAAGLVASPLAQGAFLASFGVVAFASRRKLSPLAAYAMLALAAGGIYQSGTRGAMLALLVALPLFLAAARPIWAKERGRGIWLDVALLALGVALSLPSLAFIVSYSVGLEDGSTIGHVAALEDNLRDLPSVLLLGEGVSEAGAAAAGAGEEIAGGGEGSLFSIAFQIGVPGALLFLWFCAAVGRGLNEVRRSGGEFAMQAAALLALLVASGVHLMSSEIVLSVSGMGSFWVLAGAVIASGRSAPSNPYVIAQPASRPAP